VAVAIPQGEDSAALADWVEISVISGEREAISFGRIGRLLKGEASELADQELREETGATEEELEADELEVDLGGLGQEAENVRDQRIEFLEAEIERRARLGPRLYPFRIESERVKKVSVCGEQVYLMLLVLGSPYASYRAERRAHQCERAFDAVALTAMTKYLGREADGVRFARNSADPEDPQSTRPRLFSEAIEWLRDRLDARSGQCAPSDDDGHQPHWEWRATNPAPVLNTYKDAGVDLVVWSGFGDNRPGFPVVLAQCTVQLNWEDKLEEISLRLWQRWINFSMVPPQTALVIPFGEDPRSEHWEDRCLRAGIVIDRLRLLELLSELECEELEALVSAETREWVARELATI
jgi:predicted HTH domain antitoxin